MQTANITTRSLNSINLFNLTPRYSWLQSAESLDTGGLVGNKSWHHFNFTCPWISWWQNSMAGLQPLEGSLNISNSNTNTFHLNVKIWTWTYSQRNKQGFTLAEEEEEAFARLHRVQQSHTHCYTHYSQMKRERKKKSSPQQPQNSNHLMTLLNDRCVMCFIHIIPRK